jgi:hypothetical protein
MPVKVLNEEDVEEFLADLKLPEEPRQIQIQFNLIGKVKHDISTIALALDTLQKIAGPALTGKPRDNDWCELVDDGIPLLRFRMVMGDNVETFKEIRKGMN